MLLYDKQQKMKIERGVFRGYALVSGNVYKSFCGYSPHFLVDRSGGENNPASDY